MRNENKIRAQLIEELEDLRWRVEDPVESGKKFYDKTRKDGRSGAMEKQVEAAQQLLEKLQERASWSKDPLLTEGLQELAVNFEELNVAREELRQQKDELAINCRSVESKCQRIESILELERDRLNRILETIPLGIYIVNQQYDIEYINPILVTEFGLANKKKCYTYFHERTEPCPWCKNQAVFSGKTVRWEWTRAKTGKTYDLFDAPVRNIDGSISKLEIFNDITERKQAEEALSASEKKYREMVDFLPISIFEINIEGNIVSFNNTSLEVFGYKKEDYDESMKALQFFEPKEWERLGENMQKVIKGKSVPGQEYTFLRKDGSTFPGLSYSSRIIHENEPVGIRGAIIDVTERKSAEEALRKSEEKYRSILENIEDGYYEVDLGGNLTFFNDAMMRINGYSRDEMMGMNNREYVDAENAKKVYRDFNRVYSTGESSKGTVYEMITKNGERKTLETSISLRKDSSGKPIGFRGIVRDITELRRTQTALLESEDRCRDLVESSRDLICTHDLTGKILWMNEEPARILGCAKNDLLKMNVRDFLVPGRKQKFDDYLATLRSQGVASGLLVTTTAKGERRIWEYHNTLRTEGIVEPVVRGIAHDVTERMRAEKETKETLGKLRKAMGGIIHAMALTVESRDPYTAGHQRRVSILGRSIAQEMGLSNDHIEAIRMAGTVHDLGKISVPSEILSKSTKLSDIEFSLIKVHPQTSYDILKDIDFPWPIARIALQHHERIDGSGYPSGLKGDEIMIEARVLMVADVVEATASHRPYRPAHGIDVALDEIEMNKGILYDSEVVDACLRLFREKGFNLHG